MKLKLLPTPVKGDGKGARQSTAPNPRSPSHVLSDLVYLSNGAATSPPSDGGKQSTALRLSPSFVGWMLGTATCGECGAEWTDPACRHSVTAFRSTSAPLSDDASLTLSEDG